MVRIGVVACVLLASCFTDQDPEAIAHLKISRLGSSDSTPPISRSYIQMWGSGKTPDGWKSKLVSQVILKDKKIPLETEITINENQILKLREKYSWRDSIELFFIATLDINGDARLCSDDFRTIASDHMEFAGDIPASKSISIEVIHYEDTASCEQIYPDSVISID